MKKILFFIVLLVSLNGLSQDTLTYMQYNLLNYGNTTSYCTEQNNNMTDKDQFISTILNYVQPDIFAVNEVGASRAVHQHLLDFAVNNNGSDKYRMADFIFQASPYLVNLLFYNHEKLVLHSHVIAQSYIRDLDVYRLYYKSNDLEYGDTAFIVCVVGHLKAGNSTEDAATRQVMALNTMTFLTEYGEQENYILSGDFNVYTSSEAAYQTFTQYDNTDLRFSDPLDKPGSWNNNSTFAQVHTQSTHTTSNGCASTGGMDDRFDFILMSNSIKFGTRSVRYVPGSYRAVGQDGLHFNKNLLDSPTNTTVPADVLNALYENSDHLPVMMKLSVEKTLAISEWLTTDFEQITYNNPVSSTLFIDLMVKQPTSLDLKIYNLLGNEVWHQNQISIENRHKLSLNLESLQRGLYLIKFTDGKNQSVVKKLVVKGN